MFEWARERGVRLVLTLAYEQIIMEGEANQQRMVKVLKMNRMSKKSEKSATNARNQDQRIEKRKGFVILFRNINGPRVKTNIEPDGQDSVNAGTIANVSPAAKSRHGWRASWRRLVTSKQSEDSNQ
jgi:hypothetical protein